MRRDARGDAARLAWVAIAALAIGAAGASADDGPRRGRPSHGPPPIERVLERHSERLGLDAETREKIRAIAREGREAGEPRRDELRALKRELRALLSREEPDEAAVLDQAEAIGRVETELQKQRLRTMLAIRALLSPEQRRELVRIHEEMRAERRDRRERWRELRGGE